jgi:hypothetical protein
MAVIERTCDRCARFAEDCTVIEDAYICGGCRAEIAAEEAEVEALRRQLRGAVGTLVRIATLDYDPLQHESPGSLAREALAAMGVDPATYGGQ